MVTSSDIYRHYRDWDYKGRDPLCRVATALYRARTRPGRLSPLVFMTDPKRINDPVKTAKTLPEGSTVIYRHFGKADRYFEADKLRQVTFERAQQFLIGADPDMAIKIGADGVHFRRDATVSGPSLWRKRCPDWLITMAGVKSFPSPRRGEGQGEGAPSVCEAHNSLLHSDKFPAPPTQRAPHPRPLPAGRERENALISFTPPYTENVAILDGLFISSIFPSQSPSAGAPIGVDQLKKISQSLPVPVFALGGVNGMTAQKLQNSGASGIAAVGGFS